MSSTGSPKRNSSGSSPERRPSSSPHYDAAKKKQYYEEKKKQDKDFFTKAGKAKRLQEELARKAHEKAAEMSRRLSGEGLLPTGRSSENSGSSPTNSPLRRSASNSPLRISEILAPPAKRARVETAEERYKRIMEETKTANAEDRRNSEIRRSYMSPTRDSQGVLIAYRRSGSENNVLSTAPVEAIVGSRTSTGSLAAEDAFDPRRSVSGILPGSPSRISSPREKRKSEKAVESLLLTQKSRDKRIEWFRKPNFPRGFSVKADGASKAKVGNPREIVFCYKNYDIQVDDSDDAATVDAKTLKTTKNPAEFMAWLISAGFERFVVKTLDVPETDSRLIKARKIMADSDGGKVKFSDPVLPPEKGAPGSGSPRGSYKKSNGANGNTSSHSLDDRFPMASGRRSI